MPQEEIKKIAKEYALKHSSAYVTASLIESIINGFTEQLSKDYCIVPKSKVKEVMKYPPRQPELIQGTMHFQVIGIKKALIDIFGKSLFEEEK